MLFNSQVFILGFLPIVLLLYYGAAERRVWRQAVMVVASLLFYGWWDMRFVPLLVGLTLANWLIVRAYGRWRRDWWLVAGVVMNLAVLGACPNMPISPPIRWPTCWARCTIRSASCCR